MKNKSIEVEKLINYDYCIICITETQCKLEKILFTQDVNTHANVRKKEDKKREGLLFLYKNISDFVYNTD